MSQLEELEKLYAKAEEFTIPEKQNKGQPQAKISITPLSLDELDLVDMDTNAPMSEQSKNIKKLFAISLGVTEEEVAKISFAFMEEIMRLIMKVNNFSNKDVDKLGIKNFIEEKRKQKEKEEQSKKDETKA